MIVNINSTFSIEVGNATDVGLVREKNEDYFESFESSFGYVSVVCDGMGGHIAGEIASRLAVATVKEYILNNPNGTSSTKQIIIDSLHLANQNIIDKWNNEPELKGMGTTIVIVIVKSNVAYYANVGDSRIYLVRNSKIFQITKDHSFVQTLVDGGLISYEEAEKHPRKNEITQALGISESINVSINEIALQLYKGDTFILCSDGLSGMVSDEEIQRISNRNNPQEAAMLLIATANKYGGHDNITVQLIKVINGNNLPDDIKNMPPPGALNKNISKVTRSKSGINKFEKTSEIPAYVENIGNSKRKKNKAMIYLLLIFFIIIFGGLTFYVLNQKDKSIDVSKNQIIKPEKNRNNISGEIILLLKSDSIISNSQFSLIEIDSAKYESYLKDKKEKNLKNFDDQNESNSTKFKFKSGDYIVTVYGANDTAKFIISGINISEPLKIRKDDERDDKKDIRSKEKDKKPPPKKSPKPKSNEPKDNVEKPKENKDKKLNTPK